MKVIVTHVYQGVDGQRQVLGQDRQADLQIVGRAVLTHALHDFRAVLIEVGGQRFQQRRAHAVFGVAGTALAIGVPGQKSPARITEWGHMI